MLPDERWTLDDCHLRFYEFWPFSGGGIGGFPARLNEFAHMGAIGWLNDDGSVQWQCGGSLIWENFVLTAAHCVVDSRNRKPSVVRFGDLNLYTTEGDETAQQIEIADIIRHPLHRHAAHYHDIALFRLKESVKINPAIIPACLWTSDEVRFPNVEATGWGSTGFGEDASPILLKMKLSPLADADCRKFYGNDTNRMLRKGIQSHQICAWDEKADTCEGDSGGPLQVKLMHGMRETPFIIGVTSFGLPCGKYTPGVYTRVATYYDWIRDTMIERGAQVDDDVLNSTMCALRNAELRDFYDGVVVSRNGTNVQLNVFDRHIDVRKRKPGYMVRLDWPKGSGLENCYGVLADDEFVITVASCAEKDGVKVSQIVEPSVLPVSQIFIHPRYEKGSSYYNIALLKLETVINFGTSELYSVCIWHTHNIPRETLTAIGSGRVDVNSPLYPGNSVEIDPSIGTIESKNTIQNRSTCKLPSKGIPRMEHGLVQEHICTGNDFFLVPNSCELVPGSPLREIEWREERRYSMVYALNQPGSRDCGYGEHVLSTRLSSHLEWMRSVMLPSYHSEEEILRYVEKDLSEGEGCELSGGIVGRCVPVAQCFDNWSEFSKRGNILFCSSLETICCPTEVLESRKREIKKSEIEECPDLVRKIVGKHMYDGTVAFMAWDDGEGDYDMECMGSLITQQLVLTTASCLDSRKPDKVYIQGAESGQDLVEPLSVSVHENYDPSSGSYDVALIALKDKLSWNKDVYPVCLWMNLTHTPLMNRQIFLGSDGLSTEYVSSMYNSDCQRIHSEPLHRTQLCGRSPTGLISCKYQSAVLHAEVEPGVPYLIGMEQQSKDECQNKTQLVFTRIAPLVEWVERHILG